MKKHNATVKNTKQSSDDDDLQIDFKPITKFFSGMFKDSDEKKELKTSHKEEKSEEDIDISFAPTVEFFKSKKKLLIPFTLILIALLFSTYIRMIPADLPMTDNWAQSTVDNYYRNQIRTSVDQQYPNLPTDNKNALVETQLQKFKTDNKDVIAQQTAQLSQNFKSNFKYTVNGKEYIYLSDIDTYVWYGEVKNYLKYGHFGTDYVNGVSMNMLRNGRQGLPSDLGAGTIHMYFEVYLYKFAQFFNNNVQLTSVVFLMSVIVIGLSIIPAFFIGRKVGGNIGGFFAAMIIGVNPSLLSRTVGGVADTDPYNIFFPLMIMWMFLEAFESKEVKKQVIYSVLAAVFVGLFSYAWIGWWYTFDFIAVMIGCYVAYLLFIKVYNKEKIARQLKEISIVTVIFVAVSFIIVAFINGASAFTATIRGPLGVMTLKSVGVSSIWPNVLTTVAENNATALSAIISQMGGPILFFLALSGIVLLLYNTKRNIKINNIYVGLSMMYYLGFLYYKDQLNNPVFFIIVIIIPIIAGILKIIYYKENEDVDIKLAVLIIIWFVGTAYGFTKGIRFGILMVPAFAIATGAGVGIIYNYLSNLLHKEIELNKTVSYVLMALLFSLLLVSQVKNSYSIAENDVTMMNDAWYDSLTAIKDNATDGMITSWWDFGHWFVAISERRVTFDGADQGERIHWVGKSLLTSDQDSAVGILRMLNCGQQNAPHVIQKYLNLRDNNSDKNTVDAIDIVNEIIREDKKTASKILTKKGFSNSEIEEILINTHCDNLILPHYYITSEDMVGKSGVWAHFGIWNFSRAHMFNDVINNKDRGIEILKNDFGLSENDAQKTFYEITSTDGDQWIAPWPSYMSGESGCSKKDNETLLCSNGMMINLTDHDSWVPTKDGNLHPKTLVYVENETFNVKEYSKGKVLTAQNGRFIGVALIKKGESYSTIMMDYELSASMFTRLFYYDGVGLDKFEKFTDKTDITGQRIITWKVKLK